VNYLQLDSLQLTTVYCTFTFLRFGSWQTSRFHSEYPQLATFWHWSLAKILAPSSGSGYGNKSQILRLLHGLCALTPTGLSPPRMG